MKVIHDIPNQQINFLDERFYQSLTNPELYYPSVTTVLEIWPKGYGYTQWLKDLGMNAEEVLRRAGEQGTHVHTACDTFLKGHTVMWCDEKTNNPIYTLEEWKMFLRFVDFYNTHQPQVVASEIQVVSDKMRLGGTIDLVCRLHGENWLIDNKTSNAIRPAYELQLAKYAEMWNEAHPEFPIHRTGVMWLKSATRGPDKSGKKIQGEGWILKEFDRPYSEASRIFDHARAIWDEENPTYKPKNLIYPAVVKMGM